ncbi:transglycosylase SLT domain-containing protein [Gandjariella thermophila]|nr:transglycosylase SLT domain-containing protein [Gandjariella thermophila]
MRRQWLAGLAVVTVVAASAGCQPTGTGTDAGRTGAVPPAASPAPASPGPAGPALPAEADPARFATQVVARAHQAGINPTLLMAILYNESYKPHDPGSERAWLNIKPDAALGVANMHRATYDQTRRGRDFANRDWQELPDDPDLAIEAAAWYLHDLANELPAKSPGTYTRDELLALGYNAGVGNMRAFARGVPPGAQAQSYLDRLRANWPAAEHAVKRSS